MPATPRFNLNEPPKGRRRDLPAHPKPQTAADFEPGGPEVPSAPAQAGEVKRNKPGTLQFPVTELGRDPGDMRAAPSDTPSRL